MFAICADSRTRLSGGQTVVAYTRCYSCHRPTPLPLVALEGLRRSRLSMAGVRTSSMYVCVRGMRRPISRLPNSRMQLPLSHVPTNLVFFPTARVRNLSSVDPGRLTFVHAPASGRLCLGGVSHRPSGTGPGWSGGTRHASFTACSEPSVRT
jgi:hypothetical protein